MRLEDGNDKEFTSLDDFIIDNSKTGRLGSGSFASVFLGVGKQDRIKYAIKKVH